MTSDELFWRLVVVSRTVDETALLWWLAAVRADEFPYRSSSREISRCLGNALARSTLLRATASLVRQEVVEAKTVKNAYVEFRLNPDRLARRLGQSGALRIQCAVPHFDPLGQSVMLHLPSATACARLCILRGNREDAILLAWLHQAGAAAEPLRVSSRDMEGLLCGLVDRRTAMRAMARLQSGGLVVVTPLGRAGTQYRLDGHALEALLATFPFHEDAAATMPGWANLTFPLLQRLAPAAEATQVAEVAALQV